MVVVVSWRGHANANGSLVFIDDVTSGKSSRMNSGVFCAILSAHIQPNASELIGRRFTVQMDNDWAETQRLLMSMRSRLQAVIDCKGFATKC